MVADLQMTFVSMVMLLVTWALASIPALMILVVSFSFVTSLMGTVMTRRYVTGSPWRIAGITPDPAKPGPACGGRPIWRIAARHLARVLFAVEVIFAAWALPAWTSGNASLVIGTPEGGIMRLARRKSLEAVAARKFHAHPLASVANRSQA
ncbi:MAG: hypothetical protein LUO80_07570 [Methylococcaceae bacterium]|nr:hypothetical protein [Methylococcaceae bacterium]